MKIAVLEDNAGLLRMLQIGLEQAGYEVTAHHTVKSFCAFFIDASCADLIITDFRLTSEQYGGGSQLSGTDVIRKARNIAPDIPAIVISAAPLHTLIEATSGLSKVQIVRKPFTIHDLTEEIKRLNT